MSSAESSLPVSGRNFVTTRWSMVLSARGDTTGAQTALEALCAAYWYPLYAFVRREGHAPHDAQDLTQEFFARLLEKGWLGGVARERGRFRSFLLASMKHFLANEWDRAHALKRGGCATVLRLDEKDAEGRYRHEPADQTSAERLYDRRWALTLLDQVLTRLRTEMTQAGKLEQFELLKFSLTGEQAVYADVARALQMTEAALKVAIHRLRQRYRALIRAEIAQTVADPTEVDDELRHLFATLS
jgi:DNA-directed RNA polymerase specialized sigma24 family protein